MSEEQFWRIPSTLTAADLRSRIDFLKGATDSVSDGADVQDDFLAEPVEMFANNNSSAKRVADEPIPVGSQKRRRIINSESSNSDNEEEEKMQTQDVVQQTVEAVVVETSTTAASTTSRKRFDILDSISDSE